MKENVAVVGAGAIGTLLGAYLQIGEAAEVSLIGRSPDILAINNKGLHIEFPDGSTTKTWMKVFPKVRDVQNKPDWIIFTVRTYQTDEAMNEIAKHWGKNIPVVTFQNGFVVREIQKHIGDYAIGGETLIGSKVLNPGEIKQPQRTGLYVGEMSGGVSPRVTRMKEAFESVQRKFDCMEAFVTENIEGAIWAKLLINATNNAITAVTDISVRQYYETEQTQKYAYHLVKEVLSVVELEKVDVYNTPVDLARAFIDNSKTFEDWKSYLEKRVPSLSHFKLSMSDMLEKGVKTEVDHINGYVVERARAHGISAPYHEAMVEAIHKIEQGKLKRGLDSLPKI